MNQGQRYTGTKTLRAWPMSRGEYNDYRGWEMPEGENRNDAGYLVEYEDGGKANDSRHAGYISWSPADVFERAYHRVDDGPKVSAAPADTIEQEIQAKASKAPRVTPADIEAAIAEEVYFTGSDGRLGATGCGQAPDPLSLLTFCVLVLRNGFTVTGESACASPENFDVGIGRKVARANAVQKVWPLLGYALKERLAGAVE